MRSRAMALLMPACKQQTTQPSRQRRAPRISERYNRANGEETACQAWSWSLLPFGDKLLVQRRVGEPLVTDRNGIALLSDVTALLEKPARAVARIHYKLCRTARTGEFFQCVDQHGADALTRCCWMDVKHINFFFA